MIDFISREELITSIEIEDIQEIVGAKLPEDYKKHMLEYNGGKPVSYDVYFGEYDDGLNLLYFYPIKHGMTTLEKMYNITKKFLPENHISIGKTRIGGISMSLNEKDYGHIYTYYSDEDGDLLTTSFEDFLKGLKNYA